MLGFLGGLNQEPSHGTTSRDILYFWDTVLISHLCVESFLCAFARQCSLCVVVRVECQFDWFWNLPCRVYLVSPGCVTLGTSYGAWSLLFWPCCPCYATRKLWTKQLSSTRLFCHDAFALEPVHHRLNLPNNELNQTYPPLSHECWVLCPSDGKLANTPWHTVNA